MARRIQQEASPRGVRLWNNKNFGSHSLICQTWKKKLIFWLGINDSIDYAAQTFLCQQFGDEVFG